MQYFPGRLTSLMHIWVIWTIPQGQVWHDMVCGNFYMQRMLCFKLDLFHNITTEVFWKYYVSCVLFVILFSNFVHEQLLTNIQQLNIAKIAMCIIMAADALSLLEFIKSVRCNKEGLMKYIFLAPRHAFKAFIYKSLSAVLETCQWHVPGLRFKTHKR